MIQHRFVSVARSSTSPVIHAVTQSVTGALQAIANLFNVLDSTGAGHLVSRSVLGSDGTAYTVSASVLDSTGASYEVI